MLPENKTKKIKRWTTKEKSLENQFRSDILLLRVAENKNRANRGGKYE